MIQKFSYQCSYPHRRQFDEEVLKKKRYIKLKKRRISYFDDGV